MSPDLRVIVYPPDAEGGRRVRCDGEILGPALGPADLLEFLRRAGLDPDVVRLDDPLLIEWRGGGPAVWSPDREESSERQWLRQQGPVTGGSPRTAPPARR